MKCLLLLTSFIALSVYGGEPPRKRLKLEDTYEPMEQDQEFWDSEKKFSLPTFMFIYNHRAQLDAFTNAIIEGQDALGFNVLEEDFKNLSSDMKGEVKELAYDLNVPKRLHPGLPAEVWEMINKQIFKDISGWPLIRIFGDKILQTDVKNLTGHIGWVLSVAVAGDKIISASHDRTIKIWNMNTYQCERTLRGHIGAIRSMVVKDNKIISGSTDKTIKIWDIETGECLHTFTGHTGPILSIIVKGDRIISGSADNTIKIWDIKTGVCKHTFTGHTGPILSIIVKGDRIISGSDDKTIKIWNMNTYQWERTLTGHTRSVTSILVSDNRIISASDDKTIKIWNMNTGVCEQDLMGHTGPILSIIVKGDRIISASHDKTIKIWNMNTYQWERTLRGHTGLVLSVAIEGDRIISGSADKTIKIWNMERWKAIERALYSLPVRDVAILTIIQGEIVKDEEGQLKEDLCDKDGLNPLQKAQQLGASSALIQWLEQVGCEEQLSARN